MQTPSRTILITDDANVYASRIGGPESRKVAVVFADITERKQAEASNAQLAAIVMSSVEAIYSNDFDGRITRHLECALVS